MLAEARRLADRIRREAERDAASIRREAAAWASSTRAEAEQIKEAVLAQLSAQRTLPPAPSAHRAPGTRPAGASGRDAVPYADIPPPPPPPPPPPNARPSAPAAGVTVPASTEDGVLVGEVIDLRAEAAARRGHAVGEVIEVNLESKLYDVVVLALRRTFEEPASS